MTIKEIVNGNRAVFDFYRNGKLYYNILVDGIPTWQIPVDITDTDDIGNTTFINEYKAITLMRYVRKAIVNDSLIKLVV